MKRKIKSIGVLIALFILATGFLTVLAQSGGSQIPSYKDWITDGQDVYTNSKVGIGIQNPQESLDVAGNITATGAITAEGTGGNVVHSCVVRSTSGSNTDRLTASCNGNEFAISGGGGCATPLNLRSISPVGSGPSGWEVIYTSTCNDVFTVYAVCCER